jgi:hypothetical protein
MLSPQIRATLRRNNEVHYFCMYETTRELLNGLALNLTMESFNKICQHFPILVQKKAKKKGQSCPCP